MIHFPVFLCFAGYSTYVVLNIGNVLRRLPIDFENYSRGSLGGSGTMIVPDRAGWLERPCITARHSLCRGS